MINEQAT